MFFICQILSYFRCELLGKCIKSARKMMEEVLLNPDKLCRICLRADEEFQSIFEENIYKMIEEVSIYKVCEKFVIVN